MRASNLFVGGIIVTGSCHAFTSNNLHRSKRTSLSDNNNRGDSFGVSLLSTVSGNIVDDDIPTIENLSKCTVPVLKDKLRSLNLAVGGNKSVLIERLNDYYLSQTPIVNQQDDLSSVDIVEVQQDSDIEQVQNQSSEDTTLKSTDVIIIPSAELEITIVEDLSKLTVIALKDRLRDMGLPVGGKKSLLIERLHTAMEENALKERLRSLGLPVAGRKEELLERLQEASVGANNMKSEIPVTSDDEEDEGTDTVDSTNEDATLLNLIDDILDDMDIEDEEGEDATEDEFTNEQLHLLSGERSSSVRRARRKKYWKTQEVRELLKNNDPHAAAAKAEEMISSLEMMAEKEDDVEYLPSQSEYTLLIESYASIGTYEGVQRAEAVIDRILESSNNEESNGPTLGAKMLNALISSWAAIGTVEAAEKATALLEKMEYMQKFGSVKPTVHSYSIAISAWAKCQNEVAAENAELILNRLFENYDQVLQNDQEESGYIETLKPNGIVFNSVIDAWANSGSINAGEQAEALLHRMEVLSRLDEYDVRPDTISFNTCIKAWCNSNRQDAPMKAEQVLSKLEMNPQYPKRAGGVLTVRPNKLSYNTVIHAWAKSQLPESAARAEGLLLRMVKSFKSETFATVTPDAHTFSSVLNALAKSKNVRNKAVKCSSILKAMIDLHEDDGSYETMPNIICYNTVLNACAFSAHGGEDEKRQALAVAVETFNQMRQGKYVSPDAVTYGDMLKCCANLMPPGNQRNAMASRLFASCCDAGMVGGMSLDEIRRCLPPRAFLPLLADCGYDKPILQRRKAHSVELKELPHEWTMNVKRGDMMSRQRASFAEPKRTQKEHKSRRQRSKNPKEAKPFIRRPGLLFEYGASGRDM